jgi:gamma-glutamyl phosphate reductase
MSDQDSKSLAQRAKRASLVLGALSVSQRNNALQKIYNVLKEKQAQILEANQLDMEVALTIKLIIGRPNLCIVERRGTSKKRRITVVHGEKTRSTIAWEI